MHVSGTDPVEYRVMLQSENEAKEILKGNVSPHEPFSFQIPVPGELTVECSDGTMIPLTIEDGYKYGGGKSKSAFIFDKCPWVFVVMHDRTYFYNRETKDSYIEPVSPDAIIEISEDFVIFQNEIHSERTIYSLIEQRPILTVSGILYHNASVLVWEEQDEVIVYSLMNQCVFSRTTPKQYLIDEKGDKLLYAVDNVVYSIGLDGILETIEMPRYEGVFRAFIDGKFSAYISVNNMEMELHIVNHDSAEIVKVLNVAGYISSINRVEIIDVKSRKSAISNFNFSQTDFPEATITAQYYDYMFYPCEWDIYYLEQVSTFCKNEKGFNSEKHAILKSLNSPLAQTWRQFDDNKTVVTDNRFLLYNKAESFVHGKFYSAAGYKEGGRVRVHRNVAILEKDNCVFTLSRNGYWENKIERDYKFDKFESFGVVLDNETGTYRSFIYNIKGKEIKTSHNPTLHIILGNAAILPGGKVYFEKSELYAFSEKPLAVSTDLSWGVGISYVGKVYLISLTSGKERKEEILKGIFDNSKYESVLLSEDGKQILYRNCHKTEIKDINSGETITFDNLSYVKQTNGIRPFFSHSSSLQPRIVDPVTGQFLDSQLMKKFKFISPNGILYAGILKDMYAEHFYIESGEVIPEDVYKNLVNQLSYPSEKLKGTREWENVTSRRIQFIKDNFSLINVVYPKLTHNSNDEKRWEDFLIDKENKYGVHTFIGRIIDIRGIATIKKISDNSVVAKIALGKPLSYINYVSFSYNSRYVALGGYRDVTHGLFLIYDLETKKTLCRTTTNRAVWTTAFSSQGAVAAYTSNPNTIFFEDCVDCIDDKDVLNRMIRHRNFLTFSPDGSLMALSNQGYTSKYDINGEERFSWGHQPSTIVEIRITDDFEEPQTSYRDLSDCGIADSSKPQSVASVSFSNDNKRLMMVGEDGVVIIRNLHLEDYAGE